MTHCARVLALLSDGQPHSHSELYALHVIAHSRVSDLRRKGYRIDQWRDGDLYLYRLVSLPEGESMLPAVRVAPGLVGSVAGAAGKGASRSPSESESSLAEAAEYPAAASHPVGTAPLAHRRDQGPGAVASAASASEDQLMLEVA
jgi:hypothetical protein